MLRRSSPRLWLAALGLLLAGLAFHALVDTHIELAFYPRRSLRRRFPKAPPPLSTVCFSPAFLASPFAPVPAAFPLSPSYNLSVGTLGLAPKVLSLSPGFGLPHYDDCYAFARTLPAAPLPSMASSLVDPHHRNYFHLYWRSDLAPVADRQIITLKSLLATQDFSKRPSMSKPSSQVVLWTNPSSRSLLNDPLLAPLLHRYSDRLSLRVLDLDLLTAQTPIQNHPILRNVFDKRAWLDGDLVRVLVLWHYGGYWIDMDNLVLRDLRVLGEHEWVVMWDCYDKPYEPLNGHMMHFFKHSPYLCEMLHLMASPPAPRPASTDWGQHLYIRLYRMLIHSGVTPFKVLPFCLTDGRSCTLKDRLPDPFASLKDEDSWNWSIMVSWDHIKKRLSGVFSIHLHNQWGKEFPKDGWVRRLYVEKWEQELL